MTKHSYKHPALLAATLAVILGLGIPQLYAAGDPFDEASIYFELNNTDGDLGIHSLIDGDAWKNLSITDASGRKVLDIKIKGRLRDQGLTELFFESAEPPFESDDPDEVVVTPEEFFQRFPEGSYRINGVTLDSEMLESLVGVTHLMPGPPNVYVDGVEVPEDCDEEPLPVVGESFEVSWDAVTSSHPEIGRIGEPVDVEKYQVVLEREEPTPLNYNVDVDPGVTSVQIPAGLVSPGDEIKIEVVVREASGNQTATESCFEIED